MSWQKISLREAVQTTREEWTAFKQARAVRFFPIFALYALAVIALLKISQLVLGWTF